MATRKSIDLDDILAKEIPKSSDMIVIDAEEKVSKKSVSENISNKIKKTKNAASKNESDESKSENTDNTQIESNSIVSKLLRGVVIEEGEIFNGEEIKNLGNMTDVDFLKRRKREDKEFEIELNKQWDEQNMDKNIAGIEIESFMDVDDEDFVTEDLPDENESVEKNSNSQIDKLIEDLLK